MGRIYSTARLTLAFIADGDPDESKIFKFIEEIPDWWFRDVELQAGAQNKNDTSWLSSPARLTIYQNIPSEAIRHTTDLPYFSRVWIIQEIILSQQVTSLNGVEQCELPALIETYVALDRINDSHIGICLTGISFAPTEYQSRISLKYVHIGVCAVGRTGHCVSSPWTSR